MFSTISVLAKQVLLSSFPDFKVIAAINGLNNDLDGVLVDAIGGDLGSRKDFPHAVLSGEVFLLPTVSVAALFKRG